MRSSSCSIAATSHEGQDFITRRVRFATRMSRSAVTLAAPVVDVPHDQHRRRHPTYQFSALANSRETRCRAGSSLENPGKFTSTLPRTRSQPDGSALNLTAQH